MSGRITRAVIESFLKCKTKARLKLQGEHGVPSDYELFLLERRDETRRRAIEGILAKLSDQHAGVLRDLPATIPVLRQGAEYVLDTRVEDHGVSIGFDALKKVSGASSLGDSHYVPVLFQEGTKIRRDQRLLLAILGTVLGDLQGRQPEVGIVILGDRCRGAKVHLTGSLRERAREILREIQESLGDVKSSRLMLNSHCQQCEFRERCRHQAEAEDDISLLDGMGEKELRKHNRKGIFTVTQLSCTFRLRKRGKRVKRQQQPHYFALQGAAIRDRKVYVLKPPPVPVSPVRVYFDIEGNSERTFAYLLGLVIDDRGIETRYSLWADTPQDEQIIFGKMLEILGPYDDYALFHYGSYESSFLRRMKKTFGHNPTFGSLLARSFNLLPTISSHIYFPVYSNGLKAIGRLVGCKWTDPNASGLRSIVLRSRWEVGHDDALKRDLERYNLEDCLALKRIAEIVTKICEEVSMEAGPPEITVGGCRIARAADINTGTTRREYGKASFVLPDLEQINSCAYFDYQRQKVFLRTNRTVRKAVERQETPRTSRSLPVNRTIKVRCSKCPHCRGSDVIPAGEKVHTKMAYDLRFTRSGIMRQVIACTCVSHHCKQCHKSFLPPRYMRRDKHFHSLKSWAIYQHIVHRVSFQRLQEMIWEFFGMHVHYEEIHHFKALMANYYRSTYQRILLHLVNGRLIHADETHVNLQKGKGYIWVLANMEEAVYIYRPTRDGDWLQGLLSDFTGVLVSDFYSAYDTLKCEQQKCLVHLIRDMNHDLLCSPFDEEFKLLVSEFGSLLRGIVATIDRYGLRRHHLHKHEQDVDKFYRNLGSRTLTSDLALEYWKRLDKYRGKLFIFLRHDGIPWNNNNAEHAFRPFANYRKSSDGQMTEVGVRDYVVLLTIYQTCRYRGISFLRFLLSREKDIYRFGDPARTTYSRPSLQVYPKGFSNLQRMGDRTGEKPLYPNG